MTIHNAENVLDKQLNVENQATKNVGVFP